MMNRYPSILAFVALAMLSSLAPGPLGPDEAGEIRDLAAKRVEIGKKIADFYADPRVAAPTPPASGERGTSLLNPMADQAESWIRKVVDARLDAATDQQARLAILAAEVQRTKAIETRIKTLAETERGPALIDADKAAFYRLDAEYRLARAKAGL